MYKQLGPIDVSCDAPAYPIVRACGMLGFESPLDVRWCRLSRFPPGGEHDSLNVSPWKWFTNRADGKGKTCTCGEPLPLLENYAFTPACAKVLDYRLAQCRRCHTIF